MCFETAGTNPKKKCFKECFWSSVQPDKRKTPSLWTTYVLFASLAVEEAGPLEAGLLTAHPEHRRDSYDQHHQVLDQEQGQVRTTGLLHLQDTHRRCGCDGMCVCVCV